MTTLAVEIVTNKQAKAAMTVFADVLFLFIWMCVYHISLRAAPFEFN